LRIEISFSLKHHVENDENDPSDWLSPKRAGLKNISAANEIAGMSPR
jgi:hypothetical protein